MQQLGGPRGKIDHSLALDEQISEAYLSTIEKLLDALRRMLQLFRRGGQLAGGDAGVEIAAQDVPMMGRLVAQPILIETN